MNDNDKNCSENCGCDSGISLTGLLAFLGLASLAYVGYKKRNDVDWTALGEKACDLGSTIKDKTSEAIKPIAQKVSRHSQHLASDGREKMDDLKNNIDSMFDKIDDRLAHLSGEKRVEYEREIKELKNRFKRLID